MSSVEKVSVALSSELLAMVKAAVATGEYTSSSEVIREALRDWRLRQPLRKAEIERLRKAWEDGDASGAPSLLDFDDVKQRARLRFDGESGDGRA